MAVTVELYKRKVNEVRDKIRTSPSGKPTYDQLTMLYDLMYYMFSEFPDEMYYIRNVTKYVKDWCYARVMEEKHERLYWDTILLEARNHVVDSGLLYLEKNRVPKERFYEPRREVFMKHGIVQALQDLIDDVIDIFCLSVPPGCGKLLADDTPILTENGWKNHGDLVVGDRVYGLDGKLKRVTHIFQKNYADCLVTFTNGEQIQCHENHEWVVYDRHRHHERIVSTKELEKSVLESGVPGKRGHRYFYQIPNREPFTGIHKEFCIPPYILGAWLGDGTETKPAFTICDTDTCIVNEIKKSYELSGTYNQVGCKSYHFLGLRKDLEKLGMCHSRKKLGKRIPEEYLNADINQRLELLAGLIDTDGDCSIKDRKYHFSTTNEELKDGFVQLVSTFGWRCCVTPVDPQNRKSYGLAIGNKTQYRIGFSPTIQIPCRVERKKLNNFSKQRKIAIKSIERVKGKRGNCIQVEDGIYCAGKTMIPTHNSTLEVFFLTLVGGWFPNDFNLSSAHSGILTRSLYDGINEILDDDIEYAWHEMFPNVKKTGTNAKETTVNLERTGRFKTWTFRSIDGSLTGATRCNRFLTADDMVSGIEEALNKNRLETLWTKVVNDLRSRRMDKCKEIYIATRWSVHDPIGKLYKKYGNNPRAKFIAVPALDKYGESNFNFSTNGFSKEYFEDQKDVMDEISFNALYMQKPVEREGVLLPADELKRFFLSKDQVPEDRKEYILLPDRLPDAIWGVCDTKDTGSDFESLPIFYQYGDLFFMMDALFDDTTDYEVLDQRTADIIIKHNPHFVRFEANNAGGRVAYDVENLIKGNCTTEIETRPTSQNKETKILSNSGWIKKHCYFLDSCLYSPRDSYGLFMGNVVSYTTRAKVPHDDGIDSLAMFSELIREKFGREEEENTTIVGRRFI